MAAGAGEGAIIATTGEGWSLIKAAAFLGITTCRRFESETRYSCRSEPDGQSGAIGESRDLYPERIAANDGGGAGDLKRQRTSVVPPVFSERERGFSKIQARIPHKKQQA